MPATATRETEEAAPAAPATLPADLDSRTSAEIAIAIRIREQLDVKRAELDSAREDLAVATMRVGTSVPVYEDDGRGRQVQIGVKELGLESAGVLKAQKIVAAAERDLRFLQEQVWPHDVAALTAAHALAEEREAQPSTVLRARMIQIDEQRHRRREDLMESQALLAAAQRERADIDDPKDLARLEVLVARRTRELTGRQDALQREVDDTERELVQLRSAVPAAEQREADEAAAAAAAEIQRVMTIQVRRRAKAFAELTQAEAALKAMGGLEIGLVADLARSIDLFVAHAARAGIQMIRIGGDAWEVLEDGTR